MEKASINRILSLDLLKGLVMVIMALDHTRDYFHADSFFFDPTDPLKTDVFTYFTRWITHYCAPAFSFLAGISAFLVGMRKTKKELSKFLLSRGIWLIFIELTVVTFAWFFDVQFSVIVFGVIWVLGLSMVFLSGIVHLPLKVILWLSLIIIFGHNLLDAVHYDGNILWGLLHERQFIPLLDGHLFVTVYPLLPWLAVMSLGYFMGSYYNKNVPAEKRRLHFTRIGVISLLLFFVVRYANAYGSAIPWKEYDTFLQTAFSFMDPLKYPPSLTYLLMTLGGTFLFLGLSEKLRGKWVEVFSVFGRVPFFYYIIHLYVIHIGAMALAELTGFGWESMLLTRWVSFTVALQGYGLSLGWTYVVWIVIVLMLYPLCKRFSDYKLGNKEKWWLSYL